MCMAGNQVMGMGAGTQSGNNVYPGPYTSNQAPPPNDSGNPPPEKTGYAVVKEGAGDSEDESKAYDRSGTKVVSGGGLKYPNYMNPEDGPTYVKKTAKR